MSRENHIYEPDWSGRTDQLCSVCLLYTSDAADE